MVYFLRRFASIAMLCSTLIIIACGSGSSSGGGTDDTGDDTLSNGLTREQNDTTTQSIYSLMDSTVNTRAAANPSLSAPPPVLTRAISPVDSNCESGTVELDTDTFTVTYTDCLLTFDDDDCTNEDADVSLLENGTVEVAMGDTTVITVDFASTITDLCDEEAEPVDSTIAGTATATDDGTTNTIDMDLSGTYNGQDFTMTTETPLTIPNNNDDDDDTNDELWSGTITVTIGDTIIECVLDSFHAENATPAALQDLCSIPE
ncbi:hypothetical protein K1X76_11535 [bacterium]|nr:hypothetical protein [bacterium]